MTSRLITPPAAPAVSIALARASLRIDDADQDDLIEAWVAGITAHAEHCMGRAIIHQTWATTLDSFPDAIKLANPPVVSVSSLKFRDVEGVLQTLDPADYTVDTMSEPSYVVPAAGRAWPATDGQINAVTVEYICGYGTDDASTPKGVRLYILAKLVEQFDPSVRIEKDAVQASFTDRLLDRFRVYG